MPQISYTRELGSFPTKPQIKMKSFNNSDFPNITTFNKRLGIKAQMACKVVEYCENHSGFDDVKVIAQKICEIKSVTSKHNQEDKDIELGFVY